LCVCAGLEWLASLLIGLGVLPLSFLTRFITRAVFKVNVPRAGTDRVDMDIGYGAVVHDDDSPLASLIPANEKRKGDGVKPKEARRSDGKEDSSSSISAKGKVAAAPVPMFASGVDGADGTAQTNGTAPDPAAPENGHHDRADDAAVLGRQLPPGPLA
jgi:hypothetical protein